MVKSRRYVARKMTGGSYGDDGYYWKVVEIRKTKYPHSKVQTLEYLVDNRLSRFDARALADDLNAKNIRV